MIKIRRQWANALLPAELLSRGQAGIPNPARNGIMIDTERMAAVEAEQRKKLYRIVSDHAMGACGSRAIILPLLRDLAGVAGHIRTSDGRAYSFEGFEYPCQLL